MDRIDEALKLSSFTKQYHAIKALVHAAGDEWMSVADDPRVTAWQRANGPAMWQILQMNLEAAVNDTIAAQISTPATPKGNRRTS